MPYLSVLQFVASSIQYMKNFKTVCMDYKNKPNSPNFEKVMTYVLSISYITHIGLHSQHFRFRLYGRNHQVFTLNALFRYYNEVSHPKAVACKSSLLFFQNTHNYTPWWIQNEQLTSLNVSPFKSFNPLCYFWIIEFGWKDSSTDVTITYEHKINIYL